jgi:hypothetical protein
MGKAGPSWYDPIQYHKTRLKNTKELEIDEPMFPSEEEEGIKKRKITLADRLAAWRAGKPLPKATRSSSTKGGSKTKKKRIDKAERLAAFRLRVKKDK